MVCSVCVWLSMSSCDTAYLYLKCGVEIHSINKRVLNTSLTCKWQDTHSVGKFSCTTPVEMNEIRTKAWLCSSGMPVKSFCKYSSVCLLLRWHHAYSGSFLLYSFTVRYSWIRICNHEQWIHFDSSRTQASGKIKLHADFRHAVMEMFTLKKYAA